MAELVHHYNPTAIGDRVTPKGTDHGSYIVPHPNTMYDNESTCLRQRLHHGFRPAFTTHGILALLSIENDAGQMNRRLTVQAEIRCFQQTLFVLTFQLLLDDIVVLGAAGLPVGLIPEQGIVALVWNDVIDNGCQLDPIDSFTSDA
ncbi:hypothetical protein [Brucella tritici]|uniref:hypothetical protein n=1 Tax=Brucella tritici TaxID=94626 RepID=UPI003D6D8963